MRRTVRGLPMRRTVKSMVVITSILALALVGLFVPSASAAAALPKVAVVSTDTAPYTADVVAKLTATGKFTSVTAVDALASTPTLATLQTYDAVLAFTEGDPFDQTALGNVLADYVDSGHRVAIATFSFYGSTDAIGIGGRLESGAYLPFTTVLGQDDGDGPLTLVSDVAGSPLLAGVTSFNGGSDSYRDSIALATGATLVAHWSDGGSTPLVGAKGNVVGLNLYPPSSTVQVGLWDATTAGGMLMANALVASAYDTALSAKAPSKVARGSKVKVKGKLTSAGAMCSGSKSVTVTAGSKTKTKTTDAAGAYSASVKINKKTKVKVSFAGDAVCGASKAKKVIRVA